MLKAGSYMDWHSKSREFVQLLKADLDYIYVYIYIIIRDYITFLNFSCEINHCTLVWVSLFFS